MFSRLVNYKWKSFDFHFEKETHVPAGRIEYKSDDVFPILVYKVDKLYLCYSYVIISLK